jgi:ABC-type antimicrobial peptide transport system permease subunit
LASATYSAGHALLPSQSRANVAVISKDYATSRKLSVGSSLTIAGTAFRVVGIATVPGADSSADVYIPLARAQALSDLRGSVNTIYVAATSNTQIGHVAKEISAAMPKATVTTSSSLAKQVTGSLSSASSLANSLGRWLAIAVLAAAFLLASLLTLSAVSRRVREFGTLKALGWRSRRIVSQVVGESVAIGVLGAGIGVVLGLAGAAVIAHVAGPLHATVGSTSGPTPARFGGASFVRPPGFGGGGTGGGAAHAVAVHLTTPVTITSIVLAVALALAGGLLSGAVGGWRAARLRPAAALSRVA